MLPKLDAAPSKASRSPMNSPSATLAGGSYSGRLSSARFSSALRCRVPRRLSSLLTGLQEGLTSLSSSSACCCCSQERHQLSEILPQRAFHSAIACACVEPCERNLPLRAVHLLGPQQCEGYIQLSCVIRPSKNACQASPGLPRLSAAPQRRRQCNTPIHAVSCCRVASFEGASGFRQQALAHLAQPSLEAGHHRVVGRSEQHAVRQGST